MWAQLNVKLDMATQSLFTKAKHKLNISYTIGEVPSIKSYTQNRHSFNHLSLRTSHATLYMNNVTNPDRPRVETCNYNMQSNKMKGRSWKTVKISQTLVIEIS